jgi:2-phosphosulfolactate phosphatase
MTTTNGTRALRASAGAGATFIGSFVGLQTLVERLHQADPCRLLLVCSGTLHHAAYEDALAAGALCDCLGLPSARLSDAAQLARQAYLAAAPNLMGAMEFSRNGRRLLAHPELAPDVAFCLTRDSHPLAARLDDRGEVVLCRT